MDGTSCRFELFVDDQQKSVEFYTKILRFNIGYANDRYISLTREYVIIGISSAHTIRDGHYFLPELNTQRTGLGVEIVLEIDDITTEYTRIKNMDYPIYEQIKRREWGLTDFRIIDPDGYYLRLTSKR